MEQRLRRKMLRGLESLGEQASRAEPGQLVTLARTEIRRLTDGWRRLLAEHQPDEDGRCQHCSGWLKRRRWPCQVWLAAHQHLIGEAIWTKARTKTRPGTTAHRKPTIVLPRQRPPTADTCSAITAVPSLPTVPGASVSVRPGATAAELPGLTDTPTAGVPSVPDPPGRGTPGPPDTPGSGGPGTPTTPGAGEPNGRPDQQPATPVRIHRAAVVERTRVRV